MCKIEKFRTLCREYREIVVRKVFLEKDLSDILSAEDEKLKEMRKVLDSIKKIKTRAYVKVRVVELNETTGTS